MAKVAEVIRFYSLDDIESFIEEGGEYPLHHVWCYDKIKESGIDADCIEFDENSFWNKFGKKLKIQNLQQQLNILKHSNNYDLIYVPFPQDAFLLAVLKSVGLYKKPILALGLDAHFPTKKHIKGLREKITRRIFLNGYDTVMYFSKKLYDRSNEYSRLNGKHAYTDRWGVDFNFFNDYVERQATPPSNDFIHSTGGSVRDYKTLIEAFKDIDFKLKITTKTTPTESYFQNLTSNIIIDDTIQPGLHSVGKIRKDYYNALAVAIPILNNGHQSPFGITVVLEAMAMSKPIISTENKLYPFNLEKEKVGLYVDYGDVEGWRQSVNYLVNNPDEAREMGERGRHLCKTKYNYDLFSTDVISQIQKMMFNAKKAVNMANANAKS